MALINDVFTQFMNTFFPRKQLFLIKQDEYADFFDESYEERLKDFEQKAVGSSKPDYTCPKCVQFLPANLLVNVPDVLWEL